MKNNKGGSDKFLYFIMTEIHRYFQLKVKLQTTLNEERSASPRISNYFQQGWFVWISNYSQQGAFSVAKDFKLNSARLVCLTQRNAGNAVILWRSFGMEHNELFKVSKSKNKQYDKIVLSRRVFKISISANLSASLISREERHEGFAQILIDRLLIILRKISPDNRMIE